MKRIIIIGLCCVIGGIFFLELIQRDSGYVLVSIFGKTFESSFWFSLFVIIASVFIIYFISSVVRRIAGGLLKGRLWWSDRRFHALEARYREGILFFLTDNWEYTQKRLNTLPNHEQLPLVRSLISAKSAFNLGHTDKAFELLDDAEKRFPEDSIWIAKTRTRLYIDHQDYISAEESFTKLKALAPYDKHVKRIELDLRVHTKQLSQAAALLPDKRRQSPLTLPSDVDPVQQFANELEMLASSASVDNDAVEDMWQKIPKKLKQEPRLVTAYIHLLMAGKRHALAEELIVFTLARQWLPELVDCYAKIATDDVAKQLVTAERWYKKHADSHELLIALGVLAIKNQLWGKARGYLDKALEQKETPQAYYMLGLISEKLGDEHQGNAFYKKAASINAQP